MLLEGTTKTNEAVVVVGAAEVIQMAVAVEVVAEEAVDTKMGAANITNNLETIIQGITITIEDGVAEVVGTLITIMVQQFRVVTARLMLVWLHDVITHWVFIGCRVTSFLGARWVIKMVFICCFA